MITLLQSKRLFIDIGRIQSIVYCQPIINQKINISSIIDAAEWRWFGLIRSIVKTAGRQLRDEVTWVRNDLGTKWPGYDILGTKWLNGYEVTDNVSRAMKLGLGAVGLETNTNRNTSFSNEWSNFDFFLFKRKFIIKLKCGLFINKRFCDLGL